MRARLLVIISLAACGGSSATQPDAGDDAAIVDGSTGCPRTAAPADRARHVVVSHPYDAAGGQAGGYEVLDLAIDGTLTRPTPNRLFTMGRAVTGTIAFTPDGEVGLAATDDGKLAVFTLDATGTPTVVHAEFAGSFYATRVIVDPRGDRAIVLDGNTRDNGGGIYAVTIGCDGTLTDRGMVAAAKLPGGIALAGDHAVVAAGDVLGSTAGADVHLLDWTDTPSVLGGTDAFGDDMAIIGGTALSSDGKIFLVGDVSQFSGIPNRIAVVGVDAGSVRPLGKLSVEDPEAIAVSPFGDVAVVASAFGDKLFVLDAGGAQGAWRVRGEVAYMGARPMLPGDVATIDRGMLRGRVLVSENVSIRQLAFRDTGAVDDLGSLAFGSGLQNIGGAIGITP
jgi:DNA-binding beta-propeller fold protein YncE